MTSAELKVLNANLNYTESKRKTLINTKRFTVGNEMQLSNDMVFNDFQMGF